MHGVIEQSIRGRGTVDNLMLILCISDRCTDFACHHVKDLTCFFGGLADDYRCLGLDDASLFHRNLFQGVTEELCVVKTDVGDDGKGRGDDVRAVQSSTHTCLNDSDIHSLVRKILKRHSGHKFKEGWLQRFEECLLILHKVNHIFFWDGIAIDADALREIHQMG